jgi:hypothetical protein
MRILPPTFPPDVCPAPEEPQGHGIPGLPSFPLPFPGPKLPFPALEPPQSKGPDCSPPDLPLGPRPLPMPPKWPPPCTPEPQIPGLIQPRMADGIDG